MVNVCFRNARYLQSVCCLPSFMVSCDAAASQSNGFSSHFSTPFPYYTPTHTQNSSCPRTSVCQSVSEHRMCQLSGRKARPNLSSLLSRCFRMHQGDRHAILLQITLSMNLPMTSHALSIIHSASVAIRLHACVRILHDARRTGNDTCWPDRSRRVDSRLHGNCGNRARHLCSTETKNRGVRKSRLVRVGLACDYCTKERLTSQMQVLKQQTTLNTTITSSIIAV